MKGTDKLAGKNDSLARPRGGHLRALACAAVYPVLVLWATAGSIQAQQQSSLVIDGSVHDTAGNAVEGASVRLQLRGDASAEERKTDFAGSFAFSGLHAGSYVISASKGGQQSNELTVMATAGASRHVDLTVSNASTGARMASGKAEASSAASEMEFSDLPSFTVAAVTDWTAAGGHGSDTSLRTSEALTRETLRLKANPIGAGTTQPEVRAKELRLRAELEQSPRDFEANAELGELYLKTERYPDAVPPLETAYQIDKSNKKNEYELALVLNRSGDPGKAREHVQRLLGSEDKPEWHRLAGEVDENLADPLGAVREFERAVKEDPSEENYFAWGSELLVHRAIWQAKDVFASGVRAYPQSARLLTALGAALFAGALYDDAARRLCEASDLVPNHAEPYLFMGKVEIAAPSPLPCIETKLSRFVELQPSNPLANYYYAMAYWKQRSKSPQPQVVSHVEELLNRAVALDPKCSSAYLELGILRASQHDFKNAVEDYRKAIEADPQLSEAHYRLGVAYDRLGKKDDAALQFKLHDEIEKQQSAAVERQRREIKQFLVLVNGRSPAPGAQP